MAFKPFRREGWVGRPDAGEQPHGDRAEVTAERRSSVKDTPTHWHGWGLETTPHIPHVIPPSPTPLPPALAPSLQPLGQPAYPGPVWQ